MNGDLEWMSPSHPPSQTRASIPWDQRTNQQSPPAPLTMLRGPSPLPSTSNQPSSTLSSFEVYTRVLKPPPLSSSKPLDAELQRLVHFILRDFISSWYSGISSHDEFYSEVVQTLAVVLGKIESRLAQVSRE